MLKMGKFFNFNSRYFFKLNYLNQSDAQTDKYGNFKILKNSTHIYFFQNFTKKKKQIFVTTNQKTATQITFSYIVQRTLKRTYIMNQTGDKLRDFLYIREYIYLVLFFERTVPPTRIFSNPSVLVVKVNSTKYIELLKIYRTLSYNFVQSIHNNMTTNLDCVNNFYINYYLHNLHILLFIIFLHYNTRGAKNIILLLQIFIILHTTHITHTLHIVNTKHKTHIKYNFFFFIIDP
eukprot:TRINITY_DN3368_c0_g5_i2.p1 TRINITY_DN3368_c0_g5~~TRINITY_DN3368_c0_g5_i2.p1  ORF type:complete len:234 (-),score=-12.14 TRINITY_DN3368_c0_g5_i2:70-771(-)